MAEIERKNDLTLEQLAAECQRIASLKDSNTIALGNVEQVLAIRRGTQNIASRHDQYHQNRITGHKTHYKSCPHSHVGYVETRGHAIVRTERINAKIVIVKVIARGLYSSEKISDFLS